MAVSLSVKSSGSRATLFPLSAASALVLVVAVAWIVPSIAIGADREYSDIPPGHWAHGYVMDLTARGILRGFPDGTFRGDRPVDRYTLARAVARTLEESRKEGDRGLSAADRRKVLALAGEVKDQLETLGLRVDAMDERLSRTQSSNRLLTSRVERLEKKVKQNETFGFDGGELRIVGYDNAALKSFTDLILTYKYSLSDQIHGIFAPEFTGLFDKQIAQPLTVWEAYADFDDLGPITRLRAGRQLYTLGDGLTLANRIESFDFLGNYGDMTLQVAFLGDLMGLVETEFFTGQLLGFYYIQESQNSIGAAPIHVGTYLKGPLSSRLSYATEYANYSNRAATTADHNIYTQGFLADLKWNPSHTFGMRLAYIVEDEDFRALSIDRDLSWHRPANASPLEDVLQAITDASQETPTPVSPNEINGFADFKAGLTIGFSGGRTSLGLNLDHVTNNSLLFNNQLNGFNVVDARLKHSAGRGRWVELRGRYLDFTSPQDANQLGGTLQIPRVSRTDVRIQFYGTF